MKTARWRTWLDDVELRLWFENNQRGSDYTAKESMRVLYRYCQRHKTTPQLLVQEARKDPRVVENQLLGFIGTLEREGKAPSYIKNYVKALKSWLNHHSITLTRKIRLRDPTATPTLVDERVPTRDELRSIMATATPRGRVIMSFIAFAGLRPEVLGNMKGTDGLSLGDVPELKITGRQVVFDHVPLQVRVRSGLSKAGHAYVSFLSSEGCDALKAYLEDRLAAGETMDAKTPIIRVTPGWETKATRDGTTRSPFVQSGNISREVREAMRPRYMWRPYVLRSYFDTQLLLAESNGKISHSYRTFFMGHVGDMGARYTTNKGRLPPSMMEDMRQRYRDSEQFLGTSTTHVTDTKELLLQSWREQARAYGIDPQRIRIEMEAKGHIPEPEHEIKALTLEIAKHAVPQVPPVRGSAVPRQNKVIRGDQELVLALNRGWRLVANLGNKYIVEAPT